MNAGDYIIVLVLSTLASIGTTPIPSSSLVLTVMIAVRPDCSLLHYLFVLLLGRAHMSNRAGYLLMTDG